MSFKSFSTSGKAAGKNESIKRSETKPVTVATQEDVLKEQESDKDNKPQVAK